MSLEKYWGKRKFEKIPKPKEKVSKTEEGRFIVHDHFAEKAGHHHDFRLEMEGVLKSWAVPKLVPEKTGVKRLAISVEDHPISYYSFTGVIPSGSYGAGTVKIFDKGRYKLIKKTKDRIFFKLNGKNLEGNYNLVKFKSRKNQWLLFKTK